MEVSLPSHLHSQEEIISELSRLAGPVFSRFARTAGVQTRRLALPIEQYAQLNSFTDANNAYLEVALELGEQALKSALESARIRPEEVDLIISTTVTGLTVPSLEARLAARVGFRSDVKRLPLFGLGCVAGAAGIARLHDYLRAYPGHVAVLLAVELCTLTIQRGDTSAANLVATCLFGDGAAAVVATGASRAGTGPQVIASRSRLYPDTEDVMGWDIGSDGFRIILSADVAPIAQRHLPGDVGEFLGEHGLSSRDIASWVCHPGGPKVIDAIEGVFGLPPEALAHTRNSLRDNGNLSSVSVLDVMRETMLKPPPAGSPGLMIAMGPGFCSELVLLRW